MSVFGLNVSVREGDNAGPPIENARVSGEVAPARTNADGVATIDTLFLTVEADGFHPYIRQPYIRPSLDAPVSVSLRRR